MANLTLPGSPSDGDTVTHEGTKFTYDGTAGRWTRELLSSKIETVVPSTNTSVTATSVSGNTLVFTQADGSTANVDLSSLSGGQVTTYATESDLPSDADNGAHGYVTATTFLYVKATSGWYKITSVNLTPAVTVSSNTVALSAEAQTIDVTYTVAEPEDTPVTITVSNTGISNTDQVTITHHTGNNTLTILAGNTVLSGGSLTVSASDGVNVGTGTISIDLSLGINWSSTLTLANTFIEPTQTQNSSFGDSVAIVGNTAVVGTGASREGAYVYSKSSGSWAYVQTLLPTDTEAGDQFGRELVITPDESTIIISSPGWDDVGSPTNPLARVGRVYCFTKSGSTWSQTSTFQDPDAANWNSSDGDRMSQYESFGSALAISPDGTVLAVGEEGYDANGEGSNIGRILIYTGSGSSWTFRKSIVPTDTLLNGVSIGRNVAVSNNTVVFGATNYRWGNSSNPGPYYGGAWVWTGSGASWSQQQKLDWSTRTNSATTKGFGGAVAISGDVIAIGASGDDNSTGTDAGAVITYTRSGSTWTEQQILAPDTFAAGDGFGAGDLKFHPDDSNILFTFKHEDPSTTNSGTGMVVIFEYSSGSWSQINTLSNPGYNGNEPVYQSFMSTIDVSGSDLILGAAREHSHPTNTTWNTGVAYFYEV